MKIRTTDVSSSENQTGYSVDPTEQSVPESVPKEEVALVERQHHGQKKE